MAERAPSGVWYYLDAADQARFKALWPARQGARYDADEHDSLIDLGLLEVEEFNPGPNGENMNDVALSSAGERELHRLAKLAAEKFEEQRRVSRARRVPDRPAVDARERKSGPGRGVPGISSRARGASDPIGAPVSRATPQPNTVEGEGT